MADNERVVRGSSQHSWSRWRPLCLALLDNRAGGCGGGGGDGNDRGGDGLDRGTALPLVPHRIELRFLASHLAAKIVVHRMGRMACPHHQLDNKRTKLFDAETRPAVGGCVQTGRGEGNAMTSSKEVQ